MRPIVGSPSICSMSDPTCALIGARKNWGGNRTPRGARAQAVLTSILQTAKQQGKKPFDVLLELHCSRDKHQILDLVPVPPEVPLSRSPHPPPSFAVPDIIATLPSARLAAALSL